MATSSYQMIDAFGDVGGMIPEIGYDGPNVLILVGKHRIVLDAAKREAWQRAFMRAEQYAEAYPELLDRAAMPGQAQTCPGGC